MNDLEWLARHVHEWPTLNNGMECEMIYRHDAISTGWGRHWPTDTEDGSEVTRDQWQAERERLQNKPSWDDAPHNAEWLAQDGCGGWAWYWKEPYARTDRDQFCGSVEDGYICLSNDGDVLGDWRDTLERRPGYSLYEITMSNGDKYMFTDATEPKIEWRGPEDGLPPVGTKLENWAGEIRIVALVETDHVVCMVMESDENNRRYRAYYKTDFHESGVKLHDPRTEEDRAVEE